MEHYLKFWGTRGSCPVSGKQYKEFGGNTSCLEVRYKGELAIIDAGTGILPLGNQLAKSEIRKFHLFFTHLHWDHLIGFPFFKPLYLPNAEIIIHIPQGKGRPPQELFEQVFAEEFFPVRFHELPARITFDILEPNKAVQLGDLIIRGYPAHHVYATYCFLIETPVEKVGYASDNEVESPFDPGLISFFQSCDLLIHELQYSEEEHLEKKGWGHSSPQETIPFIQEIRPRRWLVTHHDPSHTDRDLKQFCRKMKKRLKEKRVEIPIEWVSDGTEIELQE